VINAKMFELIS